MVYKRTGTGRARCKVCGEIIRKGNVDVVFADIGCYDKHHHYNCISHLGVM